MITDKEILIEENSDSKVRIQRIFYCNTVVSELKYIKDLSKGICQVCDENGNLKELFSWDIASEAKKVSYNDVKQPTSVQIWKGDGKTILQVISSNKVYEANCVENAVISMGQFEFTLDEIGHVIKAYCKMKNDNSNMDKDKRIKNGIFIQKFENGNVKFKTVYKDNYKNGLREFYYESGKLRSKTMYSNDKKNGPYESYREDGSLLAKGQYKDDKKEGKWEYYKKDGTIESSGIYQNDEKITSVSEENKTSENKVSPNISSMKEIIEKYKDCDAIWYQYYVDENGKKQGIHKSFYKDGKLNELTTYKDDKKDGLYEYYHLNGNLGERKHYKNDLLDGIFEQYDSHGNLQEKRNYKNASPDGRYEMEVLDEKGHVKSFTTYLDREKDGPAIIYFSTGGISKKGSFKNNKLDSICEYFDQEGKLLCKETYKNGALIDTTEEKITYFPNTKTVMTREKKLSRGTLHEEYYLNGKLKEKGYYVTHVIFYDGFKDGHWFGGKRENTMKEHEWEYYYDNGKLRQVGSYKDGKEIGHWITYNENGTVINDEIKGETDTK